MATNFVQDIPPWESLDPVLLQKAVSEIRMLFRSNFPDPSACTDVDARDLQLIQNDPNFVKDFVKQAYFLTSDSSPYPDSMTLYNTVLKSLQFRREYKVHDLTPRDIPTCVLDIGFCFSHGLDKYGNTIFYLIVRKNKRDAELKKASKLYSVYIMYRHALLCPDQRITFFIDSTGAGISNIDLEYLRFLLNLFQLYFPLRLKWVLVYNMPWVLNATWNLIKRWLPPKARDCLVFVTPSDVTGYIHENQLLTQYGGRIDWTYQYPLPAEEADTLMGQLIYLRDSTGDERDFLNSFESASVAGTTVTAGDLLDHIDNGDGRDLKRPTPQLSYAPVKLVNQDSIPKYNELVEMSPNGPLCFTANGNSLFNPCSVVISLRNTSQHLVAYKVKSTNLKIYKVSPTIGVIDLDLTHRVNITLNPSNFDSLEEIASEVGKDRFLIMTASYPLDKPTTAGHVMRFWKSAEQRRISKTIFNATFAQNSINETSDTDRDQSDELVNDLRIQILSSQSAIYSLKESINFLNRMLWLLCVIATVNVCFLLWRIL